MDRIEKAKKRMFVLALVLSVCLAAGIPAIPVGFAVVGGGGGIALGVIGIACTVAGFYGCPVAWVVFGNTVSLSRLVEAVEEEHLYSYAELASQLSVSEKEVRARLQTCFRKRYLTGYKYGENALELNENIPLEGGTRAAVCTGCGAKVLVPLSERAPVCPYCGSPRPKN